MFQTLKNQAFKNPIAFVSLISFLALTAAYVSQYGFGLHPCEMCWWQRYPYFIILSLFLISRIIKKINSIWTLAICSITFLVNAGIAFFHVGVEQKWWQGITTCASTAQHQGNIDDILAALQNAPLIRCDEIQFSLFGISMAGYNGLISLALALFCIVALKNEKTVGSHVPKR